MADDQDWPFQAMLEQPGVGYTIHGGGDLDSTTFSVRFRDDAITNLAKRFGCAGDAVSVKNCIVEGFRQVFGNDAVTERFWHNGRE